MENNNSKIDSLYALLMNKNVLLFSFAATIIFTIIQNRFETAIAGSKGTGFLMLQLAFSKKRFEMILASWGSWGIETYLKSIYFDFFYIFSYTTLFLSAPVFIQNLKNKKLSTDDKYNMRLLLLPMVVFSLDIVENIFHLIFITQRIFNNDLIYISSIVSSIKLILFIICLGLILMKYFEMRRS